MADDSDPYASLMAQAPAPVSAPPTAPIQPDPYASLIGKPTADPAMSTSGYVALGGRTTWGDVPTAVVAGAHQAGATLAGAEASIQRNPEDEAYWRNIAQSQTQAATTSESDLTPAAQQPGFLSHPFVSLAEGAPSMAALAVPAAIGTAVAGPVGGAIGGSLAFGGQNRGDEYNRAIERGYEPTPTQLNIATGVGMLTGALTEATGGLASKVPVSPLVGHALGVIGEGGVFGVGNAAQETASQEAEITAGKRQALDTGEILSAGEGVVEKGLFYGSVGLARTALGTKWGGWHGEQTGGEFTSTRSAKDYRKPEVQGQAGKAPTASATTDKPAADTPPPPAPPKVDPAQAAALSPSAVNKEIVTPGVTDPGKEAADKLNNTVNNIQGGVDALARGENVQFKPVEQPTVVQPPPPPATINREAPPAGDTTEPVEGPPKVPETRPTPVSAPPREDVGAITPEPDAALAAQHEALLDKTNDRDAMVYPLGSQVFG